jgi:preprotein translocase subunit SecB
MADDDKTSSEAQGGDSSQVEFTIQKLYVKDVSFEAPNSPEVFLKEWKPDTNVQLNTEARQVDQGVHEVVLTVTITTKSQDKTAYLVEVKQAGVFSAKGFGQEQLGQLLGSYCPNLLFPYVREAISALVIKGGFPDMPLAPINFDALYAQHLEKTKSEGEQGAAPTH